MLQFDSEVIVQSFTENLDTLQIIAKIRFIDDETPDSYKGSKSFKTYEIVQVRAIAVSHGESRDYTDYLDKDHMKEIEAACREELLSFIGVA
jgi:hypothetical protein